MLICSTVYGISYKKASRIRKLKKKKYIYKKKFIGFLFGTAASMFGVCLSGIYGGTSIPTDADFSELMKYAVQLPKFPNPGRLDIMEFIDRIISNEHENDAVSVAYISLEDIPEFDDVPYVAINGNIPFFTEEDYTTTAFETYGELDYLGRCTQTFACVGKEIMPSEPRGEIGAVKPTGWHTVKYDIIDGMYLYNRCHLIGYQLTGENANVRNLITGTRYLNVTGMLPFEDEVADYVSTTGNHVLYRVTPIFDGDNLLADGVLMEAWSVEDKGTGVCFNVFCYNNQPGIEIDYATGDSHKK